jgi:hypothetical protein
MIREAPVSVRAGYSDFRSNSPGYRVSHPNNALRRLRLSGGHSVFES